MQLDKYVARTDYGDSVTVTAELSEKGCSTTRKRFTPTRKWSWSSFSYSYESVESVYQRAHAWLDEQYKLATKYETRSE